MGIFHNNAANKLLHEDVFDARTERPFYIFFNPNNRSWRDAFLRDYDPERGFGITAFMKKNNRTGEMEQKYRLYTDSYVYEAELKKSSQTSEIIGFNVFAQYQIRQRQTMESAIKRIQVIGLRRTLFAINRETPDEQLYRYGVVKLLSMVDAKQKQKLAVKKREENVRPKEDLDFLNEQAALVEEQKQYASEHLFKVRYQGVRPLRQSGTMGMTYGFQICLPEKEAEQEQLDLWVNSGVGVEIPSITEGRPIRGTIVGREKDRDGELLHIRFASDAISFDDIKKNGEITEQINKEFKCKEEAIEGLRNETCPNRSLLDIIVRSKAKPLSELNLYGLDRLNKSQREAVEKAIATEDFLLIQGPPGTGKTSIITEMVRRFAEDGKRVLICSKQNLAVDNVLEKCADLYYKESEGDGESRKKIMSLRIGREEKIRDEVKGSMMRARTLEIQNSIRERSAAAQRDEETKQIKRFAYYTAAKSGTGVLCDLLNWTEKARPLTEFACHRAKTALLAWIFGNKARKAFAEQAAAWKKVNDGWTTDLSGLLLAERTAVDARMLALFRRRTEEERTVLTELDRMIKEGSFAVKNILGSRKTAVEAQIRTALDTLRAQDAQLSKLEGYRGNPAAKAVGEWLAAKKTAVDWMESRGMIVTQIDRMTAEHKRTLEILKSWQKELESDQNSLSEIFLKSVRIIGATCIGVATDHDYSNWTYDVVIVDEAGMITMHDILVPLTRGKKVILIGDHLQLPPGGEREFIDYLQENGRMGFDESELSGEEKQYRTKLEKVYNTSLFEKLYRNPRLSQNRVMLKDQYRMHPYIAEYISKAFYNGEYGSPLNKEDRYLNIAGFDKPIWFIDTAHMAGHEEHEVIQTGGYQNGLEAKIVAKYVARVIRAIENNRYRAPTGVKLDFRRDIGVITAYKAQIPLLKKAIIGELTRKNGNEEGYTADEAREITDSLAINTLDSFQGCENQIIFYSFVRSNPWHKIGFLNEVRRQNVMITRAKSLLVMVGDSETLTKTKATTVHDGKDAAWYFDELVKHCKEEEGGYIDYAKEQAK